MIQTERDTGGKGYMQKGIQAERDTDGEEYRQKGIQAETDTGRNGYRQKGIQTEWDTGRMYVASIVISVLSKLQTCLSRFNLQFVVHKHRPMQTCMFV